MDDPLDLTTAEARLVVVSSALKLAKRQAPSIGDRFRGDRPNGIGAEADQMTKVSVRVTNHPRRSERIPLDRIVNGHMHEVNAIDGPAGGIPSPREGKAGGAPPAPRVDMGGRRTALFAGPPDALEAEERIDGWRSTLRACERLGTAACARRLERAVQRELARGSCARRTSPSSGAAAGRRRAPIGIEESRASDDSC
ncbi:hypothetical protein WME89_08190 [Sorangium sp. So ce321]|uniref:hypothetical protein n=1 Tax=Sorangium sp. So ce321 TaxID=3133300 RepID=UPI003F607493